MAKLKLARIILDSTIREQIKITISVVQDPDLPDDTWADASFSKDINDRIELFGSWGWGIVTVTASCGPIEGTSHLCGCSYKSEKDFVTNCPNVDDMILEALAELEEKIEHTKIVLRNF